MARRPKVTGDSPPLKAAVIEPPQPTASEIPSAPLPHIGEVGRTAITTAPQNAPRVASFMDGTNGLEPRLAWARSSFGTPYGGWSWNNGQLAISIGGRTSRDSALASNVTNEMLTQNSVVYTLIQNITAAVIGTGLTLSSKPCAAALNISEDEARALSHAIETKWAAWASNPLEVDLSGRFDLHALAAGFFKQWLTNGEGLATLEWQSFRGASTRTKVQLLDAAAQLDRSVTRLERDNLNILYGVAFTPQGRLAGFMLRTPALGSWQAAPIAQLVESHTSWGRQRVIHIMACEDPRAVRGLSPLIAALTPAQEEASLAEFTLGKALVHASITNTIESALPTHQALETFQVNDRESHIWPQYDAWLTAKDSFYSKAKLVPAVGTVLHLLQGDKLVQHESKSVENTFEAFDKSILRRAAKAGGVSAESLTGNYADTNFSASRLAEALPNLFTEIRRKQIAARFYHAVFSAWLEEQINVGAIVTPEHAPSFYEAKEAYCCATFNGRAPVSSDPKKSTEAIIMRLEAGLTTLSDELAADGRDLETHLEQLAQERKLLQRYDLEHPLYATLTGKQPENAETPEPASGKTPVSKERETFTGSVTGRGKRSKARRLESVLNESVIEALENAS